MIRALIIMMILSAAIGAIGMYFMQDAESFEMNMSQRQECRMQCGNQFLACVKMPASRNTPQHEFAGNWICGTEYERCKARC